VPYGDGKISLALVFGRTNIAPIYQNATTANRFLRGLGVPNNDLRSELVAWMQPRLEAAVQAFFDNKDFPQSEIDIVTPDGIVRHRTKAIVHAKSVTVPKPSVVTDPGSIIILDPSLVIEPGDEIRRRIPSGREETFEVVDPVFHEKARHIPAHYQVIARQKGIFLSGQGGHYNVHVSGPNARVNIHSHDQSQNIATREDVFGDISVAFRVLCRMPMNCATFYPPCKR